MNAHSHPTAPSVDRRRFLLGSSAAAAALTLAACGSKEKPKPADPTAKKPETLAPLSAEAPYFAFGSPKAGKLVELFVDYLCPHCKHFADANNEDLKKAADAKEIELRVYTRPMLDARTGSTYSLDTANCAAAAYEQDPALFWAMDNAMFDLQPGPADEALPEQSAIFAAATKAGLSEESMKKVKDGKYKPVAEAAEEEGRKRDIGTPVLYINGIMFEDDFTVPGNVKKAIEEAKAR